MPQAANVSPEEIARFAALAARWWDPTGPMRPLHAMNGPRVGWIQQQLIAHFDRPVRLLDVGCGAGLASEALARLGHDVLGLDAAGEAIDAARAHAAQPPSDGSRLSYRDGTAEDLLGEPERFEAVVSLEVIEHVPDPAAFVRTLAALTKPGGLLILSTLNRTARSFLIAKLGAEYVARILPAGTHDWRKFLPPAALAGLLRDAGLSVLATTGLGARPPFGRWATGADLSVNYLIVAAKPAA